MTSIIESFDSWFQSEYPNLPKRGREYEIAHQAFNTGRFLALKEAHDYLATISVKITGTPYQCGPNKWCEAILNLQTEVRGNN